MKKVCAIAWLVCLWLMSPAQAGESEAITRDKISQAALAALQERFPGAELMSAQREVEGNTECYNIRITYNGELIRVYVSPDGVLVAPVQKAFSLKEAPSQLMDYTIYVLLPGITVGCITRWLVQTAKGNTLSIAADWISAWLGAVAAAAVILFALATVPRDKDVIVIGAICIVWGCISASIVEAHRLLMQSVRGHRLGGRRWIFGFCIFALVLLALSVPVDMLRSERENQYFRARAMRQIAN